MEPRVTGALLWARALLVGSLVVLLGTAGHVSAGGLLPAPWMVTALVALTVVGCAPACTRQVSTARSALLLVGGQAAVHVVLSSTGGHVGDPTRAITATPSVGSLPTVDGRRLGSLHDAYTAAETAGGLQAALPVQHLVSDVAAHGPMMLAHLAAAALVGLWLAAGERAAWSFVRLTAHRVGVVMGLAGLVPVTPTRRTTVPAGWSPLAATPRVPWRDGRLPRRGPPAAVA